MAAASYLLSRVLANSPSDNAFWSRQGNTQRKLIQHGGLDALLFNKRHKSVLVRREVARALALFASKPDSHKELLRAEGIEGMVEMLYVT